MKVVILVPRRADHGRRDELWGEVRNRIEILHPFWPIFEGRDPAVEISKNPEVPFSIAAARNDAARQAGDWDVAVVWDADTVAHPDAVRQAVDKASLGTRMWFAGDTYMNMDRTSSDRALKTGEYFPRPDGFLPKNGSLAANNSLYGEPSSGVLAVSRPLWDAIGGYMETLQGWGYEDLVFFTCADIFGDSASWIPGEIMYHLWHEKSRITDDTRRNYEIWQQLDTIARCKNKKEAGRAFLESYGHTWPIASSS
jgi:hypothetical protein